MVKKFFIWKYQKRKQLFDEPIVVIFVVVFFSLYIIRTQIYIRLSADGDVALIRIKKISNIS